MMDGIAANVLKVYQTLKPTEPFLSTALDFSSEAEALYSQWYVENETRAATSPNAAKLIKRKTVHLWKIAGVLAVMNGELEISAGAFEAARAWSDYATATIDAIASTAAERKKMKVLTDDGKRVLEAAKELGADEAPVSVREARRKTPFDKKRFDAAVTESLTDGAIANHNSGRGIYVGNRSAADASADQPATGDGGDSFGRGTRRGLLAAISQAEQKKTLAGMDGMAGEVGSHTRVHVCSFSYFTN